MGLDIKELIKLDQFLEVKHKDIDSRMYIITDIPEDTNFEPKARKEIRASHSVINVSKLLLYRRSSGFI